MAYDDIDFGSIIGDRANLYETADGKRFMATDAEKPESFDSLGLTRKREVAFKMDDGYTHVTTIEENVTPDDAWMRDNGATKIVEVRTPKNYVYRVNTYALPDGQMTTVREDQDEEFRDWATKTYGAQPTLQTHARVNGVYVSGANDQINEVLRMAKEQEAGLTAEQLAAIGVTEEQANAGVEAMLASKDTLEERVKKMGEIGFSEAESHDRGYRKLGHEIDDEWDATKATLATGLDIGTGLLDIATLGIADVVRTPEVMIQVYGNPETGLQALKDRAWVNKQADLARMAVGDAEYDKLSGMSDEELHEYFKDLLLEQRKMEYLDSLRGRTTGANVGTTITGTAESGLDFWASTAAGSAAGAGLGAAVGTIAPGPGNAIGGVAGAAGGAVAGAIGYLLSHTASERDVAKTSKMAFDPITGKLVEYAPGMSGGRAVVAGLVNPLVEWGVERVGGKIGGKLMKPVKGGLAKAIGRDNAILFGILPGVTSKPAEKGLAKLAERTAVAFRRFAHSDTWTGKLASMTGNAASRMTPAAIGSEVFEEYLQAAIEGGFNLRGELVDEYGELAGADIGNAGAAVLDVIKQTPELAMGIALYGVGSGMAVRGTHALMDGYATRTTMRKGLEKLGYTAKQLKNMKTEDMKRVFMERLDTKGDKAVKIAETITKDMSEEELKKMAEAATGHKAVVKKLKSGETIVAFGSDVTIPIGSKDLGKVYEDVILRTVEKDGLYAVMMNEKVDDVTRAALHMARERTADIRRAVQEMGMDKAFAGWGNSAEVYDSLSQALALRMASESAQFANTPYGKFLHYAADVAERTALVQAVELYGKRDAVRFMGEFQKYTLGGNVILPAAEVEVEQVFKGDKDRKEGDPQWTKGPSGKLVMRHGDVTITHNGPNDYTVSLSGKRKGGSRVYFNEADALRYANRLHVGVIEADKKMEALKERANQMYDELFGNKDGLERGMVVLTSPFEDPRVAQEMLEVLTSDGTMSDEEAIDTLRTAKGVRLNNGRFYVFLQNATSLADLATTIRHEGFHAGLSDMIGKDSAKIAAFIKEAREVIRGSGARVVDMLGDDTTEDAIDKMSEREKRIALDETLARLAEVISKKPGLRGRVATAVNKFFHGDKQYLAGLDADEKMQEAQNIITDAFMRVHGFAKEDEAKVEKDKERAREWLKKFRERIEGRHSPTPEPPAPPAEPTPGPDAPTPGPTPPTPLTPAPTSTPAEPTKPPVPTPVPVPTVANGEKDADGNIVWRRRRIRFAVRNGKPGVWVHDTDNKGRTKPGISFYEFRKPFKSKKGRLHYGWLDDNHGELKFAGAIWNDLDAWAAAGYPGLEESQKPKYENKPTKKPKAKKGGGEPWEIGADGNPVTMPSRTPLRVNEQAASIGLPIETFGELEPSQVESETWRSFEAPDGMGYILERVQKGKDGKTYMTWYGMLKDDYEWFRTGRAVYDEAAGTTIEMDYNSPASDRVTHIESWLQHEKYGARVPHGLFIDFGDDGKVVSRKEFFDGMEQDGLPGMGEAPSAQTEEPEAPQPEPAPEPEPAPTPAPTPAPEPTSEPAPAPTPTETPAQDDLFGGTETQDRGQLTSATNILFGDEEVPVEDVDVDSLAVNDRIKQFKENADPRTGVVAGEGLTGDFGPSIARPIRVMRFKDGHLEVITGRHRLDLAKRKGVKAIKAYIYDEADGMTIEMARAIDALENIKDGKGSAQDFIRFFRDTKLDEEAIRMTGFRENGRRDAKDAWDIARNGIEDVVSYALDPTQKLVSIRVLAAIARCDKRVQRAVLDTVLKDKTGAMQDPAAVERFGLTLASGISDTSGEQDDLFGDNDAAIEEAKMVGIGAAAFVKDLTQDRLALSNAINRGDKLTLNPETMARLGVTDAHDKAQLKNAYDKLSAEIAEWQRPTLSGEMRQRALERGREIERKRTGGYTQTGLFGRPSTPQAPTAPTEPQTPAPAPAAPAAQKPGPGAKKPLDPSGLDENNKPVTKPPVDTLRFNSQAKTAGYGIDVFGEVPRANVIAEKWSVSERDGKKYLTRSQTAKDLKLYYTSYEWNPETKTWHRAQRVVDYGDNRTIVRYSTGKNAKVRAVWNVKLDDDGKYTVHHGTRIKFDDNGKISAREELNPDGSVKASVPTEAPAKAPTAKKPPMERGRKKPYELNDDGSPVIAPIVHTTISGAQATIARVPEDVFGELKRADVVDDKWSIDERGGVHILRRDQKAADGRRFTTFYYWESSKWNKMIRLVDSVDGSTATEVRYYSGSDGMVESMKTLKKSDDGQSFIPYGRQITFDSRKGSIVTDEVVGIEKPAPYASVGDDFDPATYDWSKGERNGRDVTARDIRDVFGIKANIQNPKLTNSIFDAYATLAKAMNVPYEALSLGGLLPPISLNSRLKTKAGRYYIDGSGIEFNGAITPDEVGATAIHEWVHAMEYALYRGKDSPTIVNSEVGIRDELRAALRGMTDAIEGSSWGKIMKKSKSRDWSSTSEMLARAIESYMETKGVHNPHRERWAKLARLEGSPGKRLLEENRYPNAEQTAEFAPAMELFFQTLRVGTNEATGKTTLFKLGTAETAADIRFKRASAEAASSFVAREMERLTGKKWGERAKAAKDGGSRFLKWAEESFINAQAPVFRWYRSVMAHVPKDKVDDRLNIEAIIKNEPGRIRNEREQLRKDYVDRINKILSENHCDYDTFSDYLYALYVPEREAMVNARLVKTDKDGSIIFPEDPITGEIITPENSSFSGHTMAWARTKVDLVENVLSNAAAYKEAARLVHEMNRKTLERLVKGGMMTQEQMDAWLEENPHYVPLRDVDSFEKNGARFTTRVTGRTLENPANANTWAASVYQAMNAISVSVRNETKQKVVAWAHTYATGNGPVKFAILDEPKTEKYVSMDAPIYIEKTDPKYKQLEDLGVILVPSADGKGAYVYSGGARGEASKGHLGVHVRNRTKQGNNMVTVKIDGKRTFLVFDAGPASRRDSEPTRRERYNRIGDERFNSLRVAEALNDANKLRFDMPLVQAMTRFKARVSTSWNPNFIVGNLPIDMINTATIMMMEGRYKDLGRFVKNFGSALRTVYQMRRGKKVTDKAMGDALNEALEHGMMTGTFGQSFHETDADMKRAIEDSLGGTGGIAGMNKAMRGARKLTEWLDTASNITELATRLAAYKAVRDGGMGANEAAQYGREITVDFNANGNYTPVLNTLYMFSNAAAQAFIRYVDAAKRGADARGGGVKGWAQTLSMPIAINMAIGFLAALWSDGDDDEGPGGEDDSTLLRIPDYVWEGGTPIRLPFGDSYINIPMRGAFVPFMKAGRDLYLLGKGKKEEGEVVGSFLAGLAESTVNIFGKSPDFAQFIAPTIMDPMVQHWTGKDWTGRDLYRRDFGVAGSDAHMGLDRTPSIYHGIAKGLNAITGGDEVEGGLVDVRPETLKLLTDFFAGSLVGQAMTVTGIPGKLMKGEFDANDVPALGRFVRSTPDVANRYYQEMAVAKDEEKVYRKRLNEAKNATNAEDKRRHMDAAREMADNHPWLKSVKSMGALQRRITERRDRSKDMEDGPRKEAYDKETERLMGTWLRVYERR